MKELLESAQNLIPVVQNIIIPITTFSFSTFAFLFTLKNERSKKFDISLNYLDDYISEWEVDRESNIEPDVYHQSRFRIFPHIVITNNSSLPVTITEFELNKKHKFGIFTKIGPEYQVTYETNKKKMLGGVTFHSGHERSLLIQFDDHKPLSPTFTIKPYESVVGILFFHYDQSFIGENELSIITSRGEKIFPITITKQYLSKKITDYKRPDFSH